MTATKPVHIEREQDGRMMTVADGALLPSGRFVIEWRREAFPEGERTEYPTLSLYETIDDAEQASGGIVVEDGGQDA